MRSILHCALLACPLLLPLVSLSASDQTPILGVPGKVIYESKLDVAPASPWRVAKGAWEVRNGTWHGSEKPEDHHGAVVRLPDKLPDFILDYEFLFDGARATSVSINAVKDHMARILITPASVTIQRDDNDHDGPDKAVIFARFSANFAPGTWHKVHLEMVGDTLYGRVDSHEAYGSSELFKSQKAAAGFTVGGQSVQFRNLKITEATPNPEWEAVKAKLPAPAPR
ncbi:family 16 glycoside hydrolase [Verrucomicrobium spinosum]|uniref:family 16 glycoside hydrolase n=1 Tax=Verrucomicrobium spinosum TaxID=2736 RepID=UPI0009461AA6|nr:family 16 glycoside hydrolase [Verrucomicrobium spinosum]